MTKTTKTSGFSSIERSLTEGLNQLAAERDRLFAELDQEDELARGDRR